MPKTKTEKKTPQVITADTGHEIRVLKKQLLDAEQMVEQQRKRIEEGVDLRETLETANETITMQRDQLLDEAREAGLRNTRLVENQKSFERGVAFTIQNIMKGLR